jgi:anti-sigma factor RsiW
VRCSSFEALLDEYVEGTLTGRKRAELVRHLDGCEPCAALLAELRVIDALLLTPRRIEPAPNFTFAVMAEIRAMPLPAMPRAPTWEVLIAYLVFAWIAIGVWLSQDGPIARTTLALAQTFLAGVFGTLGAVADAVSHTFGGQGALVFAFVTAVLILDLAIGLVIAVLFTVVRPRLTARLARVSEPA